MLKSTAQTDGRPKRALTRGRGQFIVDEMRSSRSKLVAEHTARSLAPERARCNRASPPRHRRGARGTGRRGGGGRAQRGGGLRAKLNTHALMYASEKPIAILGAREDRDHLLSRAKAASYTKRYGHTLRTHTAHLRLHM